MSSSAMTGIHQGDTLPPSASSLRSGLEMGEYDNGLSVFAECVRVCSASLTACLEVRRKPTISCKTFGCAGSLQNRSVVQNPHAFLATTTTRLCINLAQSAHRRHEICIDAWLPEPADTSSDPALGAERSEALRLAVLVLLEKLSPTERAAYILHEAFDYSYRQIADILRMQEANTRQLVSRARKHIADGRRSPVSTKQQRRLLDVIVAAAQKGEMAALEGLLAQDVVSYACGAGAARADDSQCLGAAA